VRSRFRHPIRWRLPRHRRSYRIWGAEEDRGRYIKCWHCGFLIDTFRGLNVSDTNGNSYTQTVGSNNSIPTAPPDKVYVHEIQEYQGSFDGVSGNDKVSIGSMTPYIAYAIDTSVGACPLCGTTNLP
jgi:hypothetical protein